MHETTVNKNLLAIYRTIYDTPLQTLIKYGQLKSDRHYNKNTGNVLFKEYWAYDFYRITDYFIFPQRMRCEFESHGSPFSKYSDIIAQDFMKKPSIQSRNVILQMQKEKNCSLLHFNRIVLLYKELLGNKKNVKVLDSSAGWGDRLIASMLYGISEYVAYDPNKKLEGGHAEMFDYFIKNKLFGYYSNNVCSEPKRSDYKIYYSNFEYSYPNEFKYLNYFDICVSSPPFFAKEIYSFKKGQSIMSYPTLLEWIDNFLVASFIKALTFISHGGYLCWYIEDMRDKKCEFMPVFLEKVSRVPICKKIHQIGFDYKEINKHLGQKYATKERYFHIWQKL